MKKGVALQISKGLRARVESSLDGEVWVARDFVDGLCLIDFDLTKTMMPYHRIYIEDLDQKDSPMRYVK